ncbi:unnamed protein product [Prorocentrum cordatum]|uniref:Golgi apparatus protein 1 n=1 Tax=Prorocentrum cordatum TaxID=2364126 RepID=A0ABN9U7Z8_9DINO|nr:unnamed protein product [Polarella glacialis]
MLAAAALAALLGSAAAAPEAASSAPPTAAAPRTPLNPITAESDIDPHGGCKDVVAKNCPEVQRGQGKVVACVAMSLRKAKVWSKKGYPEELDPCIDDFREFKMAALRANPLDPANLWSAEPVTGIREACREDAARECPTMLGPVLSDCLRKKRSTTGKLSPACDAKVFSMQEMLSRDASMEKGLFDACKTDMEKIPSCKLRQSSGVPIHCLKEHRFNLSEPCRGKLFGWEVESAQDLRLNKKAMDMCEDEIESVCGNKAFGDGTMLNCLWESLSTPAKHSVARFSSKCTSVVKKLTVRANQDYRLNFKIRDSCAKEVDEMCSSEKEAADKMSLQELFGTKRKDNSAKSGQVLRCLKTHFANITSASCKAGIVQVVRTQALDANADAVLSRVCQADIDQYCDSSRPEDAHKCLRTNMDKLSSECRSAEVLQGQLEAGDVYMKPAMESACQVAISRYCSEVPPGSARVIRCLQDFVDDPGFPSNCKKEVIVDMQASSKDWRLKYGISHTCERDASDHCGDDLEEGAGKVLGCLKQAYIDKKIKADACNAEILRFVSQGVNDIRMAPNTYHACVSDVEALCEDIEPGRGRVHDCLLKHKAVLSSACAKEEFKTQAIRTGNIRADEMAARACKTAMTTFCSDLTAGESQMWQCLARHTSDTGMPRDCSVAVQKILALQHSEFFLDPAMSKHCKADAQRICNDYFTVAEYKDFSSLGDVTTCLIRQLDQVKSSDCRGDIRRKASERLKSVKLDPVRQNMCEFDIGQYCSEESRGGDGGKVHACLANNFKDLTAMCQDVQKTYMVVASSDARVNVPVDRFCKAAKKQFCESVEEGQGRMMTCLLDHMHDNGMDTACRKVLVDESKKRAMDYDFNVKLKRACDPLLAKLAGAKLPDGSALRCDQSRENWQTICLTEHVYSIKGQGSAACQAEVRKVLKLQSADLRARPGMEGACSQDINRLCEGVEAGAARWHECLREKLDDISNAECKKEVTVFAKVAGTHATIDFTIRTKCANEMKSFCKDTPAGDSRMMVCLKVNVKEEADGFSMACKTALARSAGVEDIATKMFNFSQRKENALEQVQEFIYEHESFTDKWSVMMLVGTVGFIAVLSFAVSYCILQRRFNKVMYTVAQPDSAC